MDDSVRARLRTVRNVLAAADRLEEGSTRGQELKRKGNRPPPRSRPDVYPPSAAYAETSGSQNPQGNQPPWSSCYGPSSGQYPPYASASAPQQNQQQQQSYGPHGQLPPIQQAGYPHPTQTPLSGQQQAPTWSTPAQASHTAPSGYNQYAPSYGYPQYQSPLHSSAPSQGYSPPPGNNSYPQQSPQQNTYDHQSYNQAPPHGQSPPHTGSNYPQQSPYQPPSNTRSASYGSFGSPVSSEERCIHGKVTNTWCDQCQRLI